MPYTVDLDVVQTTTSVAKELGISTRRVRQISDQMEIGYVIGGVTLFTLADVEKMRQRRTDHKGTVPQPEEPDKTRRAKNKLDIDKLVKRTVAEVLNSAKTPA